MSNWHKTLLYWKALHELGWQRSGWYMLYQFGLRTGHYRRSLSKISTSPAPVCEFTPFFKPYSVSQLENCLKDLNLSIADQLRQGLYHPFGGDLVRLDFSVDNPDMDWSSWKPTPGNELIDIKDIWEPARFGWAIHLARAYRATGKEDYVRTFWALFESFSDLNPAYRGPNWSSAQEVALRLIHLCIAAGEFWQSLETKPERKIALTRSIALHAQRIPITLAYARAQGNNHLLSEAAGIFTAGRFLPGHPLADHWCEQGWREFEQGILSQIAADGTYSQQSVCYHRLMLSLALWMNAIRGDKEFSPAVLERLQAATCWLDDLTRGLDGKAPNLGSNDGSQIIPLSSSGIENYREVVETCKTVFLNQPAQDQPELACWLGYPAQQKTQTAQLPPMDSIHRIESTDSVGFLRTARFSSRPSHADQLHFDLWWKGINVLQDAGTYRYNAPSPWDNRLSGSDVHNTVTMDGANQMTRAGKFLWLDWAQVDVLMANSEIIYAQLECQKPIPYVHRRRVEVLQNDIWRVIDEITPMKVGGDRYNYRIHWLLPDSKPSPLTTTPTSFSGSNIWKLTENKLLLAVSTGLVEMETQPDDHSIESQINFYRAGELIYGNQPAQPTWGWYSPTYGIKRPALSWALTFSSNSPIVLRTHIQLQPWIKVHSVQDE
jgi:hypothetical protein